MKPNQRGGALKGDDTPAPNAGLLGDLKDPRLMYLKAALFLVIGAASAVALIVQNPTLTTAFLVAMVAWSFSRLYYFMFYVIEKYIDSQYRFAGIYSFLIYLVRAKRPQANPAPSPLPGEGWGEVKAESGRGLAGDPPDPR